MSDGYYEPDEGDVRALKIQAQRLLQAAKRIGVVIEIKCAPVEPLAQGNYRSEVEVRAQRIKR